MPAVITNMLIPGSCFAAGLPIGRKVDIRVRRPLTICSFRGITGVSKMGSIVRWAAILAVALLVGMAWHYGIITSVALSLMGIVVGIWNLLCDVGSAFRDVLKNVFSHVGL